MHTEFASGIEPDCISLYTGLFTQQIIIIFLILLFFLKLFLSFFFFPEEAQTLDNQCCSCPYVIELKDIYCLGAL